MVERLVDLVVVSKESSCWTERESLTHGTESCGSVCCDFAGEAPTKLLARNYAHGHDSIGFAR